MKENNQVKRSLKTRHLSMIALGGSIGTGLFVASGSAISTAGPGGALAAYLGIGIMVYFLMTSLGEMATYLPITGSFAEYSKRFVDPALGFAMGWNYWFNWAITLAVDLSTAALVLKFWFPHVPGWIFSLAALVIIFLINALSVKSFGEAEYWMALIKVITVIVFLIVGLLTIIGILGGHAVFLENFAYKKAPFVGGIPTVLSVFVVAGFSFQGTELIGITAGETENPEKSLPKAIKQVFWRILLFYILSIFVIACLIPYTSPNLLGSSASDITISPFTLVFRMLFALGISGDAPKMFSRVNDRGIPVFALLGTTFVGLLTFLASIFGTRIYTFLVNSSGLSGFIAWIGIAIAHYRFRRAFIAQGHDLSELKYHAKWFPFGPLLALVLCILVMVGQDIKSFANFDWQAISVTYMSIPIFLVLFFYYKLKHKTKLIPLDEVDLTPHDIKNE